MKISDIEESHLYIYVGIDHYLEPTHTNTQIDR